MIEIRDATLADAPEMGRLMVETWLDAHRGQMPEHLWKARRKEWTPEVSELGWRRTLSAIAEGTTSGDAILVAYDGSRLVGIASCTLSPSRDVVAVSALYVQKEHQRMGTGRDLLSAVAGRFETLSVPAMEVAVLAENRPARKFYEALGGQAVREQDFDEGGELLPELVYRWSLLGLPPSIKRVS